jgi:lipopolysaccharide transport system permease protein
VTADARGGGLGELWRHRGLLLSLSLREVQVRYRPAVLGAAWAVLQPLSLALVVTLVFSRALGVRVEGAPYASFAFTGLVAWGYFQGTVAGAVPSLVANSHLVKKIWFPRETIPLAVAGAGLLDLAAGLVAAGVLLAVQGVALGPAALLAVGPLLVLVTLSVGVGLLGAAVNARWRDVKHALPLLLQLAFLATPIAWPIEVLPPRWREVAAWNPLSGIVEGLRDAMLFDRAPAVGPLLRSASVSLGVLVLGAWVFRRAERRFADEL